MVPIKKPDGFVRLCIDYRKINQVTVPDPYAIPLIEDLLDQLGEAQFLSKLDLNKGFCQIPVDEKNQLFVVHGGNMSSSGYPSDSEMLRPPSSGSCTQC